MSYVLSMPIINKTPYPDAAVESIVTSAVLDELARYNYSVAILDDASCDLLKISGIGTGRSFIVDSCYDEDTIFGTAMLIDYLWALSVVPHVSLAIAAATARRVSFFHPLAIYDRQRFYCPLRMTAAFEWALQYDLGVESQVDT